MRTFLAKFPGICGACGERFPVGAEVRYEESEVVEASCASAGPVPLDRSKLCGQCFTMHGPGQVECS